MDCNPAEEYGQLIVQMKCGHTDLYRVRLYDGHRYNWYTNLISQTLGCKKQLHTITDQVRMILQVVGWQMKNCLTC